MGKASEMTQDADGKDKISTTGGPARQKISDGRSKPKPGKDERLAEALRANLRRRKASAKSRKSMTEEGD